MTNSYQLTNKTSNLFKDKVDIKVKKTCAQYNNALKGKQNASESERDYMLALFWLL